MSHALNAHNIHTMFSGSTLDRMDNDRNNAELWKKWTSATDSKFAIIHGDKIIVTEDYQIKWFNSTTKDQHPIDTIILLGIQNDQAYFACSTGPISEDIKTKDLRALAFYSQTPPNPELAMVAQGKSMLDWHKSHQICSQCGEKSSICKMGYERICKSCETSHFPRTDPVVIMLGIHLESDSILVGRPYRLHEGVYTALAGFMEPGETIEEAVARELFEEAGVTTSRVEYIASQPWPYPSTLMIGCFAYVTDTELTIDHEELEDARWISRSEAADIFNGKKDGIFFPPHLAVAHQLVEKWLNA